MKYEFTACQVACYALGLDEDKGCADGVRSNIQLYGDVMNILGDDVEVFRTDKYHVNTVRERMFTREEREFVRARVESNIIVRIILAHDYGHITFSEAVAELEAYVREYPLECLRTMWMRVQELIADFKAKRASHV